ncbi:MAG: efflux RND transporter periplasmic adaptor subunit [Terracidiphilus sp.]
MNQPTNSNHPPGDIPRGAEGHEQAPAGVAFSPRKVAAGLIVVALVGLILGGIGIFSRIHTDRVLARTTNELAPPTVIALPARRGASVTSFVLPGNVTAYTDSPIYARTNGYLVHWYYDIGAHVQKGALLAVIDTPEVDQQLRQAKADLATAQANANIAKIQADRYSDLVKTNAVSRQDTDTFVSQAAATAAAVRSAQANVQRLTELQSFEKIYAPFDGVVTARNIDTGQLIDQGAGKELFHMQALQTLRVYTNVPQMYAQGAKVGATIDLTFPERPGKIFQGKLVRTADAIDPNSRTLLVEVDVDNRKGELMPGALAQMYFKVPQGTPTYIVPVSALIFRREGLQVATLVNGNRVHLVHVTIGEDDGATVQLVGGITDAEKVIQDPPDSLIEGEAVTPENPDHTPADGGH